MGGWDSVGHDGCRCGSGGVAKDLGSIVVHPSKCTLHSQLLRTAQVGGGVRSQESFGGSCVGRCISIRSLGRGGRGRGEVGVIARLAGTLRVGSGGSLEGGSWRGPFAREHARGGMCGSSLAGRRENTICIPMESTKIHNRAARQKESFPWVAQSGAKKRGV